MAATSRDFLDTLTNIKSTKVVRDLVDTRLKAVQDGDEKIKLIEESIEWSAGQNRKFFNRALRARLVRLLNDLRRYPDALRTANDLIRELKKVDDKDLIIEVQLEESKACYYLSSLSKARVALTLARTTANSICVAIALLRQLFAASTQADLDMQSGILHAADERDFRTAYSYFYEAFEGYDLVNKAKEATSALKYMLLCKVLLDVPEEIAQLVAHKHAIKYLGADITAICAIGTAAKNRSLSEFNEAFDHYRVELQCDAVVRKHFNILNDTMLEKELCRLIEPYSNVEIAYIAKRIGLSVDKVEKKLSQLILDKKFKGSLHQADGMLIVYDSVPKDLTYDLALQMVGAMSESVDALHTRAHTMQ